MAEVELFGFQYGDNGDDGFVQYGLGPPGIDGLVLGADGGRGSCKTFAAILRVFQYCLKYPGAVGVIVGLTEKSMEMAILPIWEKVAVLLGLERGGHWWHQVQRGELCFRNSSMVFLRTAEHPERLPGGSLAFFMLDEFVGMSEEIFLKLMPALRQAGYPAQAWLASTPGDPTHWYRKYFFPKQYSQEFEVEIIPMRGWEFRSYIATTEEATHHPELSGMTPERYQGLLDMYGGPNSPLAQQQLFGKWTRMEGLRYPTWDASYHIKPILDWISSPKYKMLGADFGWDAPSAILIYGVDATGNRRYIMDEWQCRKVSQDALLLVCRQFHEKYGLDIIVCDSADPRWISAIRQEFYGQVPVVAPKKDRSFGFTACLAALSRKVDNEQACFVAPHCKGFRTEIETYVDTEKKQQDHFMDDWRYLETEALTRYGSLSHQLISHTFNFTYGSV